MNLHHKPRDKNQYVSVKVFYSLFEKLCKLKSVLEFLQILLFKGSKILPRRVEIYGDGFGLFLDSRTKNTEHTRRLD